MGAPSETKRIQIIERIVTVLQSIGAGDDYFRTPAVPVSKRLQHWKEVTAGPAYSVHLDSGGSLKADLNGNWAEEFFINVKGIVLHEDDPTTELAHCLRDVRLAIETDMASTTSGSLGSLCAGLFFDDGAETDNGYLSLEGKGQFEQRVRIVTTGTIGTL